MEQDPPLKKCKKNQKSHAPQSFTPQSFASRFPDSEFSSPKEVSFSSPKEVSLNASETTRCCAVPKCKEMVPEQYRHCKLHSEQFRILYKRYKREQFKIKKYIENPLLLRTVDNNSLLRVINVSLKVADMRKRYIDHGFRKELQDDGHLSMVQQLIEMSKIACSQLETNFNLEISNKEKVEQNESKDEDTSEESQNEHNWLHIEYVDKTDPKQIARELKKQRKQYEEEMDILLDRMMTEKLEWIATVKHSIMHFIQKASRVHHARTGAKFTRMQYRRIARTYYMSILLQMCVYRDARYPCLLSDFTIEDCFVLRKIDKDYDIDEGLEYFYQNSINIKEIIDSLSNIEVDIIWSLIYNILIIEQKGLAYDYIVFSAVNVSKTNPPEPPDYVNLKVFSYLVKGTRALTFDFLKNLYCIPYVIDAVRGKEGESLLIELLFWLREIQNALQEDPPLIMNGILWKNMEDSIVW